MKNTPTISIWIPARSPNPKLRDLLDSISTQTIKPAEVIILFDQVDDFNPSKNINIKYDKCHQNVAGKRNELIKRASGEFLLLVDDDNLLPQQDRLEKLLHFYSEVKKHTNKPIIIAPFSWHQKQWIIQTAGLKFNYLFSKMNYIKTPAKNFRKARALGGISLFWKTNDFKLSNYDPQIGFLREDVDFDRTFVDNGGELYTINLPILHREREKNRAEQGGYGNFKMLLKKIKNRNIFVKKHATPFEKLQFYLIGYRFMPLGALIKLLVTIGRQKFPKK